MSTWTSIFLLSASKTFWKYLAIVLLVYILYLQFFKDTNHTEIGLGPFDTIRKNFPFLGL